MRHTYSKTMDTRADKWTEENDSELLKAVSTKDITKIKTLLQSTACPSCASAHILDQAFMQLVTDNSGEAVSVLKTLLAEGATAVSCKALYSVLSLLRLVNMETLQTITETVSSNTNSYDIKGSLLQALIHFKLNHLVETLINSDFDLKAFWDTKFDIRDSIMCATNLNQYARERLLPPEMVATFIRVAKDDDTLQLILTDILAFTDVDKTDIHNLLVLIFTAGYKPNNEEFQTIEKKYPATAKWFTQMKKQPPYTTGSKKNKAEDRTTLNFMCDLKGFPAQLKALLLMDIHKNKQLNDLQNG